MIRVLLADDDILVINRLMDIIDWNANGYEIIGQALNGSDCMKLLEKTCPDILILDVDMPDKDGMEITREIRDSRLNTKILILSNYDTFSFVRDTLHNGAYDYLLKHQLTENTLLKKLNEMSELIRKEEVSNSHLSFFTTVAKQKYLNSLLLSAVTDSREHNMMLRQPDFSGNYYCLSVLQINNFVLLTHFSNIEQKKIIDSIMSLATSIFASTENGLITHLEYGQFAILFHFRTQNSNADIHSTVHHFMHLLETNIHRLYEVMVSWQISDLFSELSSVSRIYAQTYEILNRYPPRAIDPDKTFICVMNMQEETELMNALMAFRRREVETLLKSSFSRMLSVSPILSQHFIYQLIQIGTRLEQNQKTHVIGLYRSLNKWNLRLMPPKDIEDFFLQYYKEIMDRAPGLGSRIYSAHIQKALLYIHDKYREDITLNSLAEYLHISPTHLSRLFRKEVEVSFIDYLVTYRIERARNLIHQSNLDLKNIAEQVGFHSYNYFLRVYKEKTGHTPTQDMMFGNETISSKE